MDPTSTFRSALHRNFDVGQNVFLQNEPFLCWITFSFIVHDFAKLLCLFIVLQCSQDVCYVGSCGIIIDG